MYTNKDHLERAIEKKPGLLKRTTSMSTLSEATCSTSVSESPAQVSRFSRSAVDSTVLRKCIICQDKKKDPKDRRRDERLSSIEMNMGANTLLQAADIRQDERLLIALKDQDLFAIEVVYHKSCYKSYTHEYTLANLQKEMKMESEMGGYDLAFQQLAHEIQATVINKLEVTKMADLHSRYVELLALEGIDAPNYKKK